MLGKVCVWKGRHRKSERKDDNLGPSSIMYLSFICMGHSFIHLTSIY